MREPNEDPLMRANPMAEYYMPVASAPNLDDLMPRAIAKAMIHTKQVARRSHQKCNRSERVQHFITDLHREICSLQLPSTTGVPLDQDLCQRSVWYDAGQLEGSGSLRNMGWRRLVEWVDTARSMTLGIQEQCDVIAGDIQLLKADLGTMLGVTSRMERINQKAEDVLGQVVNLLEE